MEDRYILDNLHDMIIVLDNELKVSYFNKSTKDIFPLVEKNKFIAECFNAKEEELNRLADSIKLVSTKMDFIFNLEKEYFYIEVKRIENNSYLVEIVNLLDSYLFNFLNYVNNGWVICAPDTQEVIYANSTFLDITGYTKSEIMGQNLNILRVDDSDKEERKKIKEAITNLEPVKAVLKNRTKNGNIIYNKVSITPIFNKYTNRLQFFLGVQNDITEEYTKKLHYRNILNTSKSIILTTDGKNLKTINKRFFDLFPFENFEDFKSKHNSISELFIPKKAHFIMPITEGKNWLIYLMENIPDHNNNILYVHKVCMLDKDGKERIFQIEYTGELFEEGEAEIVLTEITELINTQKMLMQQTKMATMGEMLSMIAHQWRQPLATLTTIFSKLKVFREMDVLTDEKFNDSYKKSLDIISYMSTTIEDFRKYFNKDTQLKEQISLDLLVKKSLLIFGSELENKNIELKVNFIGDIQNNIVTINISKINQVIVNLIKNAHDALLEREIEHKFIQMNIYYNDNSLEISIEDNAGGIPRAIIDRIFEPYFSTKAKNGTGLGLYMSKMIIEDYYNGKLEVENTNLGAKFTIKIVLN